MPHATVSGRFLTKTGKAAASRHRAALPGSLLPHKTTPVRVLSVTHKGTTKVERSHQFVKYLNFGGEGGMKTNNPADQEKAMVYNELVANAVALQTVADQTQALHALRRRGIEIPAEDLAHLSPYPTGRVKRFGEYPVSIQTESMPPYRELPPGRNSVAITNVKALALVSARGDSDVEGNRLRTSVGVGGNVENCR